MKHRVPHTLDEETARKVAEKAWEEYSKKYQKFSPTCDWVRSTKAEISFAAKGVKVQGHIELEPAAISIDMKVPLILRVFQKQAIGVIDKEIRKWLDTSDQL